MLRRTALACAAGALLLGAAAVPAQAASPAPQGAPVRHHFDLDHAGSTVAAHEGRSSGPAGPLVTQTPGMDVAGWQGGVDWPGAAAGGAAFAYTKATEGTGYTNPYFTQQYNGSYTAGLIRGAYHFALPDASGGTAQADWFVGHGGGWSNDGKTMPPAVDLEYNPYGADCYGLSRSAMVGWIRDFSTTVLNRTGRYPVIYTTTSWWTACTGDYSGFGGTDPLWLAHYAGSVGALPAGWAYQTIWQYSDSGPLPGDQDYFNGGYDRLRALATG
ncbi:hypothetical protein UK12_26375 [Saccharothrix sp. ST-888]|nr:hypothetical protein UK12_26375 [Saccharothrix sp. ST-888]